MRKSAVAALLPLVTSTFLTLPSLANELEVSNLLQREDIKSLPKPLQDRLVQLIEQPHAFPAIPAFNEAANPSLLFQYYLLDQTSFQPNVFTTQIPASTTRLHRLLKGLLGRSASSWNRNRAYQPIPIMSTPPSTPSPTLPDSMSSTTSPGGMRTG